VPNLVMCATARTAVASHLHNAATKHSEATMTFGEVSWLLFGAALGGVAAYAIPVGITLVELLMRPAPRTDEGLATAAILVAPKDVRIPDRTTQIRF
jgi:hypothetical protein